MTGATPLWAVCLIGPCVPTRLLTTCVAALTYRPCVYVSVCMHLSATSLCAEAKLFSIFFKSVQQKEVGGKKTLNEHVKPSAACQLPLSVQYCFEKQSHFALRMSLSAVYGSMLFFCFVFFFWL